jgi:CRISPR-associated protein Csa1
VPFYSYYDVLRLMRTIQESPCEVSEELRGWNWRSPPLLPAGNLKISVSDLGFGCSTGRIAYLRYRLRRRELPSEALSFGVFLHRVISVATHKAKAILYGSLPKSGAEFYTKMMSELPQAMSSELPRDYMQVLHAVWERAALTYSASLDCVIEQSKYLGLDSIVSKVVPWICEFTVDGRPLGLNRNIRIDALVPPALLIEFKTRRPSRDIEVAMTGYALAFECQYMVPVNHVVILYIDFSEDKGSFKVYENILKVGDSLRLEFIEKRDLYFMRVEEGIDPGLPSHCDPSCPYIRVCRPNG